MSSSGGIMTSPSPRSYLAAGGAALVLAAGLAGSAAVSAPAAWAGHSPCESSIPYAAGTDGYSAFRIPAVVAAKGGDLLAFAEGRHDGLGDAGNIDTVVKRSA